MCSAVSYFSLNSFQVDKSPRRTMQKPQPHAFVIGFLLDSYPEEIYKAFKPLYGEQFKQILDSCVMK